MDAPQDQLTRCFASLARTGRTAWRDWPHDQPVERFGLRREQDWVVPEAPFDPLQEVAVRAGLTRRGREWLRELVVLPVIGSTNAELMGRGQRGSVDGVVCTAEIQVQGRGRRGRAWSSPFGASLAISLGMAVPMPPARLGGVSLVVGLAVLEGLEALEVPGLALKWPNDVLLDGAKLGGILIEMIPAQGQTELVIGIGLNVVLPPAVRADLPAGITDLHTAGVRVARSLLAGRVTSAVVEFVEEFAGVGFEPFRAPFVARHAYHGRDCVVLAGDRRIEGRVTGVTGSGELVLQTPEGEQTFNGGDVSLRQPA